MKNKVLIAAIFLLSCMQLWARENMGIKGGKLASSEKLEAGDCAPATSSIDLDINNVRARLQNGGDMWWDLVATAKYEVPKSLPGQPENPSSMFAGAVWIGGVDAQGQLKVAAATYRQNGNDFFPGPLDDNASIDAATCKLWDKHFEVLGSEIDSFLQIVANAGGASIPSSSVPKDILNWPAYGNPYNPIVGNRDLAPFADADNNGIYDPTGGDYPIIDESCVKKTYADQMIWWVYNDKGNIHTETGATAIGMEVHALAFAFKTNDEVNDMTFYKYKLLNKATVSIDSTFMGQWVDPDLGCYVDDYIGCNLPTNLGIVYNAEAIDGNSACTLSYGNQPPYEGVDYFKGPLDQNGHELGMSSFLYYINDFSVMGNPENAGDYYGYLSGTWKDGTPFTYGGNAYGGATPTKYVFPDDPSDPTGWSECAAQDPIGGLFGDKRFIESSGPFRLDPGATNDIIDGVVWVRPPIGTYPCPNYKLLLNADQKAQALFDNCFQLKDGPPAPDLSIIELDKELVIALENTKSIETYKVADPQLAALGIADSFFSFEGYQLYQLANANVSTQEYTDPSKARLIFQCDIKNGVGKIINYYYDPTLDNGNPVLVPNVPTLMVDGSDLGIKHTLDVTTDAFATSNQRLINNKTYYYSIISYAYNYYQVADTIRDTSGNITNIVTTVQSQPYLAGRKNIKTYSAIPHIPAPEESGLSIHSHYGDGPELTRQEGAGNGKLVIDLTPDAVQGTLPAPYENLHPTYIGGNGPVSITVFDPKVVPNADFEFGLVDSSAPTKFLNASTTSWYLKNITTGEVVNSDFNLDYLNEQLIPDWGLKVYVEQGRNPGGNATDQSNNNNGFLQGTITFADPQKQWLSGLQDESGESPFNWIRGGSYNLQSGTVYASYFGPGGVPIDENGVYEKIIEGTWAPYRLAADNVTVDVAPAWADALTHSGPSQTLNPMDSLNNVDVVFTPDRSKWSQCIVVETEADNTLAVGGVSKMNLRASPSKDIDGNEIAGQTGRSWFPGYAIDPSTGQRLNIFFGEDSWLAGEGGDDMWWNPSSTAYTFDNTGNANLLIGGKQYVYVSRTKYDSCNIYYNSLASGSLTEKRNVYKTITWVTVPLLAPNFSYLSIQDGFIPTETTVQLRVVKPYQVFMTDVNTNNGMPRYTFNSASIAAISNDHATAVSALDTINIVPNPYYAYSSYEVSQIDNRVKITNLPIKCTITIYSLDGTLVRRISRDDATVTSYDWDLKNDAGIPIASGLYIIHVDAPGIGQRTLKWFGIMRPADLNNY